MRFIAGCIAFILFVTTGNAQITMKGSEIPGFLDKMPPLPTTVDEAYKALYPKTKKPPYQSYTDSLNAAIKTLVQEAAGKSYLLMAMADRLQQDNRKSDRVHNELPTDKELENKMRDINSSYFREAINVTALYYLQDSGCFLQMSAMSAEYVHVAVICCNVF